MTMTTTLLLSLVLLAATTPAVNAWEERLAECRSYGIAEKDCPDDDTPLTRPITIIQPTPTEEVAETIKTSKRSSSGTTRTSRVWVWTPPAIVKEEKICYTAYYRININHNNRQITSTDYKEITMKGCISKGKHPINLVQK